jgi:hypothetical protein
MSAACVVVGEVMIGWLLLGVVVAVLLHWWGFRERIRWPNKP